MIGVLFIVLGAVEMIGFVTVLANKRAAKKGGVPDRVRGKRHRGKEEPKVQPEPEYIEAEAEPKQIEAEDEVKMIE